MQPRELVERFCLAQDLSTFDPYDIWKTGIGYAVKVLYNRSHAAGIAPAAALTLFDFYLNNAVRLRYRKQEYPIVRAFAALALLNLYRAFPQESYLVATRSHLDWLVDHAWRGGRGIGWGLGFRWPVAAEMVYSADTPFATATPYPLEAFLGYRDVTGEDRYGSAIRSAVEFFEHDLQTMHETEYQLAVSYSPCRDRLVTNASSYAMHVCALAGCTLPPAEKQHLTERARRLYEFVRGHQRKDGSWLYCPEGDSFIDCFHSCIILKNILKTSKLMPLNQASEVVSRGYTFLKETLWDEGKRLFRRFAGRQRLSPVRYDLYDNAEMLSLAALMGDEFLVGTLAPSIQAHFVRGDDIYSVIAWPKVLRNKNTLRWATMPYLFALSQLSLRNPEPGRGKPCAES